MGTLDCMFAHAHKAHALMLLRDHIRNLELEISKPEPDLDLVEDTLEKALEVVKQR